MTFLLRIDDRRLHGQVLLAWGARYAPDCVVLAHDATAADQRDKARYEALADGEFDVVVETLAATTARLRENPTARHLVVVVNPRDALRLVEAGARPEVVHVAGLRDIAGKRSMTANVYLSAADAADLQALLGLGVAVELRDAPDARSVALTAATLADFLTH